MSRRNTISREFFATIAAVLVLGLSVMCAIQAALSAAYFIGERKSSLTDVLNGATALSERFADEGSIVTKPLQGEDVLERAHSGFELFNTASGALVFIADENGQILLHTGDDAFTGAGVPASYIDELNEGYDIFETGTLDGVYCAKYYTAGRRITVGGQDGYLFAASPMAALGSYMTDMLTMFGISAAVILILCSILCWVLAKRITGPIEDISEAARRLGSGDFTARAPVDGCVELADFATTFNNMAARLQTIDNSRGQFMGNIAHELRTPMTTGRHDPARGNKALSGHRLAGDGPPGAAGAEHAGYYQARGGRGAHPRADLRSVENRHRRRALRRAAHRGRQDRHPGSGRRSAADLRGPGFCASGRV